MAKNHALNPRLKRRTRTTKAGPKGSLVRVSGRRKKRGARVRRR